MRFAELLGCGEPLKWISKSPDALVSPVAYGVGALA
jgi:hypothetical protein